MSKIGILGGTFDPIHKGHLMLAKEAYYECDLDEVWIMPSNHPPHKKLNFVTESKIRAQMVEIAIEEIPYIKFSDFELNREGNTYTAQTLQLLKADNWVDQFYFIIGADSLYEIEEWYEPGNVMGLATLLVASREYRKHDKSIQQQANYLRDKYDANIILLHNENLDISSQEIRNLVKNQKDVSEFVPSKVIEYIVEHRIYNKDNI